MPKNVSTFTEEEDQLIVETFNRHGGNEGWSREVKFDLIERWGIPLTLKGIEARLDEIQSERVDAMNAKPTEDPTDPLDKITTLDTVLEAVEELSMKIDRQTVVMSALLEELTARMTKPE